MAARTATAKRAYGSGSLYSRPSAGGGETWYAAFRVGRRRVKRALGPRRAAGSRAGLSRSEAEAELRRLMDEERHAPSVRLERLTIGEVGTAYLRHLDALGRKGSTVEAYESTLRVHLVPFFGEAPMQAITPVDVEAFMASERRAGRAPKSVLNYLGFLHSLFAFSEKRGWGAGNPVKLVDKPRPGDGDPEIRFLDEGELAAVIRAVPDDDRGPLERVLYLVAAMTGLRQGELIALRWRDVDWSAGRIRVRRNFVRGQYGTPKSKRSSRAVPLADRAGAELERHFQRSLRQGDEDLVFGHPQLGTPLDRSKVLKRFKAAARSAGVRAVRFHDLRHTFGTRLAAAGVPLRTIQEWMGHREYRTTERYADYAPGGREAALVNDAFQQPADIPARGLDASRTPRRCSSRAVVAS